MPRLLVQHRESLSGRDEGPDGLEPGRAVTDERLKTALREQGEEVAGAVREVEEDHRVVRQVAQRDSRTPGEPVVPGEQDIGRGRADVRANQVLFEVVAVREGNLAFAGP